MKKEKRKRVLLLVVMVVVFLLGLSVLLYPAISNAWNNYRNSQIITNYTHATNEKSAEECAEIIKKARAYNSKHTSNQIIDPFGKEADAYNSGDEVKIVDKEYYDLLNVGENALMGYLEIPDIGIQLPIYHGMGSDGLKTGCGHLQGTSLPVGGKGTHSVLAAHRGLPNAMLFTDLDKMKKGNVFYVHILNETYAYEVDQIKTVLPEETSDLKIDSKSDYVTLLTCTPYGVNSHRLLVRGHRIKYDPQTASSTSSQSLIGGGYALQIILAIVLSALFILFIILTNRKKKKKKEPEG